VDRHHGFESVGHARDAEMRLVLDEFAVAQIVRPAGAEEPQQRAPPGRSTRINSPASTLAAAGTR